MILDHDSRSPASTPMVDDLGAAMRITRWAQTVWACTPIQQRLRILRRFRSNVAAGGAAIAGLSAQVRQRPLEEVLASEVLPLVEACRFLEREAASVLAPRRLGAAGRPLWLGRVRTQVTREPLGVVLIIAPSNYPLLLPGVQLLQALAAGNAVWVKPAPKTSGPILKLASLLVEAGLDPNLIKVLPESVESARAAMSVGIDKVLFTGSSSAGRDVLAFLAPRGIPATVELSGVDPVVILPDADLDLAADALAFGLCLNSGRTCMAPRRVFVPAALLSALEERLATRLKAGSVSTLPSPQILLVDGHPLRPDSVEAGARWVVGSAHRGPAVLSGIRPDSLILQSEWMSPLLVLVAVGDEDEAVRCANDCAYALGASVFTQDEAAGWDLAHRLRGGVVSINDLIVPTGDARIPFGGRASSGFGVTRGPEGLLDLTVPKVVTRTAGRFRPAFAAPQPGDAALFGGYLRCAHSFSIFDRCAGLLEMLKAMATRSRRNQDL
ncbi:MAG: aldehyde dehydrogenase family protein [Verrucomicrobiales bacterium]|nr:aldehyde dehydrogenase family protein [Verrucomicrobiales bacterium]